MNSKSIAGNKKTGKMLFEAGILIMIVNLLSVYGIWQSILNGWKIYNGGELCFRAFIQSGGKYVITYLNQESIYIAFLSVVFSFLGNKEEVVAIINLILQIGGIAFFYLGAKNLFRFVFPLALTAIGAILSICFYPVITDTSMHIIWFLSGVVFWLGSKCFKEKEGQIIKRICLGVFVGIFCYIDFAGFFLLIAFLLFIILAKEFEQKEKNVHFICFLLSAISGFFVMFFLWNNFKFNKDNFSYWLNDKLNYMVREAGVNQYISLSLILVVSMIFYVIKRSKKQVISVTPESITVDKSQNSILQPLELSNTEQTSEKEKVIEKAASYTASSSIEVITETEAEVNEVVKADEVINEAVESDTVQAKPEAEVKKPIKFIENPLPLPKKHVKKEMNYAFEPSKDQMHYDLNNYRIDDDYDLKE